MLKPGKYRRAFDWRLSSATKNSIPTAAEAFVGLADSEYAEILEDYLEISRKRKHNRTALAKLQMQLIDELAIAERATKHYRGKMADINQQLPAPLPEGERKRLEGDLRVGKRELFFHRMHANCIRAIGDGIAWRAFNYDRAVLRALSGKATKQEVLAEGTPQELYEWSRTFDTGTGLAILNSLTHCLAIGDVTVIKNDGAIEIVEVKSSETDSNRVTRQKQKMREVTDLIKNGEGELDGKRVSILRFDVFPENGLPEVGRILEEAGKCGCAARRISNFVYAECVDFRAAGDFDKVIEQIEDSRKREIGSWLERNDLVLDANSMDVLAFTPNCAPFSVFPFPARLCIDILTAAKAFITYLNLSEVRREFERYGWEVEKGPEDLLDDGADDDTPMLIVRKGDFHPSIPPADFMRMQMETLRPQVLIKALDAMYKRGPRGAPLYAFYVYEQEKEIWI